mgnify:CR=1 FL=1
METSNLRDYTIENKKGIKLTEAQNEIVDALLNNDIYFNCSQTGIGKTLSTLTAAIYKIFERRDDDIHFVLVIPTSAIKAFSDTFSKQLCIPYNIYTATLTRTMKNARFHIFNYSTIGKNTLTNTGRTDTNAYFESLKKLKSEHQNLWLIADEAHSLQDPNTIQYRFMSEIRPLFIGAWFLTATPILNHLDGFYHMVELAKPGFFGGYFRFRNKYYILQKNTIWLKQKGRKKAKPKQIFEQIGYKNLDILQERFSKISIIKARIYNFTINYRSSKLSESMKRFYADAAAGFFSGKIIDSKKSKKTKKSRQEHHGARLHDLQRVVSNSHKDFKALRDKDSLTEKEVLLMKTIKEVIDKNQAVLVYFSYLETVARVKYIIQRLQKAFNIPTIHEISGKISQKERKLVEDSIKPRDIVLITSAGTESINLQKANNLIFYEIPFPIREFIQACGRIMRMNSEFDEFDIYILEAEGTIDTYKKNRIMANSTPIKVVLGGSNILPTEVLILTEEDKKAMKEELLWWK